MKNTGRQRLANALAAAGAVLKRQKKHLVYALPNGKTFTTASTPSDRRGEDNALTDLRHALGSEPRVAVVNPPREKRQKPGRRTDDARWPTPVAARPSFAEALQQTGVVEQQLRSALLQMTTERDFLIGVLQEREQRIAQLERLWIVRLWRFVNM